MGGAVQMVVIRNQFGQQQVVQVPAGGNTRIMYVGGGGAQVGGQGAIPMGQAVHGAATANVPVATVLGHTQAALPPQQPLQQPLQQPQQQVTVAAAHVPSRPLQQPAQPLRPPPATVPRAAPLGSMALGSMQLGSMSLGGAEAPKQENTGGNLSLR